MKIKNKIKTSISIPLIFIFSLLFLLSSYPHSVYAKSQDVQNIYTFNTPEQQNEFDALLKNLRCLVCQNQDLNDSNSSFSDNLRSQMREWILEGKSEQEIVHILTERYGDFILFKPPVQSTTYVLWLAPFVWFIFSVIGLVIFIRK